MTGNGEFSSHRNLAISRRDYRGWRDSCFLSNGVVEAVVVPSINRIMQFRFAGCEKGVFWENRALDGMPADSGNEWRNFGGDKVWPGPQGDWESVTGRAWPPPPTFDSVGVELQVDSGALTLISPVDNYYGVQILRRIALRPELPIMEITTQYRKVSGSPMNLAVWVVTQLCDPHRVFALLQNSHEADTGYLQLMGQSPLDIRKSGCLLSFGRDPVRNSKIAMSSNSLLWMNSEYILRIDGLALQDAVNTCSAAVYTNMDPLRYVELECEGRVTQVVEGDVLELTSSYTLACRSLKSETAEARKAFGL